MIKSSDIPSLATTGIGSLPGRDARAALQTAFAVDIPYFPSLPALDPGEGLLVQALAGFPGVSVAGKGELRFSEEDWRAQGRTFRARLKEGLEVAEVFPSGPGLLWEDFLARLERDPRSWAKVQLLGPVTARVALEAAAEGGLPEDPELDAQLLAWLFVKAEAMAAALTRLGKRVLFFWDEPALGIARAAAATQALRSSLEALKNLGATVGVHCCGAWDVVEVSAWPADALSLDLALAGPAWLGDPAALRGLRGRGGRLALGIVPTRIPSAWNSRREVEEWRTRFADALGEAEARALLAEALLTPACGLGTRTEAEAAEVWRRLEEVKSELMRC
ncbi:hypothetical protein FBR05_12385 [Deltaproteobacteria bacterium PRO3]|nr:hypothetical protein [Deltaproteobacteria bacterium PRO3]